MAPTAPRPPNRKNSSREYLVTSDLGKRHAFVVRLTLSGLAVYRARKFFIERFSRKICLENLQKILQLRLSTEKSPGSASVPKWILSILRKWTSKGNINGSTGKPKENKGKQREIKGNRGSKEAERRTKYNGWEMNGG